MSANTMLEGPYDKIPTSHKIRVQGMVPEDVHQRVFVNPSPLRGMQDKIITRMVDALDDKIKELKLFPYQACENEPQLNDLLNSMEFNYVPPITT